MQIYPLSLFLLTVGCNLVAAKKLRSDSSSSSSSLDAYSSVGKGSCKSAAYEEYDRITKRVQSGVGAAEKCASFCRTMALTTHVGIELVPSGAGTACNCLYEDATSPVRKPNRDTSFRGSGEIRWVGGNIASKCFKFEVRVFLFVWMSMRCWSSSLLTLSISQSFNTLVTLLETETRRGHATRWCWFPR